MIALFSTKFGAESGAGADSGTTSNANYSEHAAHAGIDSSVGKHRGWGPALLDLCASWWRSLQERRSLRESRAASADTDLETESSEVPSSKQASNSN